MQYFGILRLNMWRRLALVISVLLVVLLSVRFFPYEVEREGQRFASRWTSCARSVPNASDMHVSKCVDEAIVWTDNRAWIPYVLAIRDAMLALAAAWLTLWFIKAVVNWILAGRNIAGERALEDEKEIEP